MKERAKPLSIYLTGKREGEGKEGALIVNRW